MLIGTMKMPGLVALIKGDPLVDVAGAYFPAWLACMVVGALGTWLLHLLAGRAGLGAVMRPAPLMVSGLFVALTCWTWLLVFAFR